MTGAGPARPASPDRLFLRPVHAHRQPRPHVFAVTDGKRAYNQRPVGLPSRRLLKERADDDTCTLPARCVTRRTAAHDHGMLERWNRDGSRAVVVRWIDRDDRRGRTESPVSGDTG